MRARQPKNEDNDENITNLIPRNRLRLGDTCTSTDLRVNWGIGKNTLSTWIKEGLTPLAGDTREGIWLVDDVIAWLRNRNAKKTAS